VEDEKSFKDLVKNLFSSYKLGDKYDEVGVINSWEQIAGKMIAQKTTKLFINNKTLYLTLSSAPLKNELRYHKLVLIEKVNTFAQKEIIKDIKFF
jgi:predicted nucleic acid-binding Zn ribbon protein